ncbi:MAG TPA: PAS domain S-box protein, partial [Candidatus Sulfotelmatobacter sp.]|nr:PAS domain S-box protein [Candidatus Sulfotelmatobacter sp.]
PADQVRWIVLVAVGALISLLNEALQRSSRRAETALGERITLQKQLARIAAIAPGAICTFCQQPDGSVRLPYASPAIREIFGIAPRDLAQDASVLFARMHPDDARRIRETMAESARTMLSWIDEFRVLNPRKGEIWVEVNARPQREPDGGILWYGFLTDITVRKHSEEALGRQASLIDLSYDGVIVWEWDGTLAFWNRGAERLYGLPRAEALGRNIAQLLHTDAGRAAVFRHALEQEGQWEGELVHTTREGRPIVIESRMVLVREAGRLSVLETTRDITARKHAEDEIRHLNASLEQRVAHRTEQLEAANRELEAFSYSVSHDLRTPLRAMDGFSQALLEDFGPQLPDEGRHYLDSIRAGAQRMGTLIDDLLAFSRLSRQPLSLRTVNTADLVRDALSELEPQRQDRPVEVRVGDLPPCEGDPGLLKQVWMNLLSNAFKYTRGRDPARIEIGCRRTEGPPVYFVRDNGAGFDMQYAGKLFGVFQRLHRADEFEGTGVGLAIVQRVVHRHGGRVWADAALDQGAAFYFTLQGERNS